MMHPSDDIATYFLDNVPHIDLLIADGTSTPEQPRRALTTFEDTPESSSNVTYCLQPVACHRDDAPLPVDATGAVHAARTQVDVCLHCYGQLLKKHVPKE